MIPVPAAYMLRLTQSNGSAPFNLHPSHHHHRQGESAYMIEAAGSGAAGGGPCGEEAWAPPGGWGDVAEGAAVGVITLEDTIEGEQGARAWLQWVDGV